LFLQGSPDVADDDVEADHVQADDSRGLGSAPSRVTRVGGGRFYVADVESSACEPCRAIEKPVVVLAVAP
jgi:hypothetical protein